MTGVGVLSCPLGRRREKYLWVVSTVLVGIIVLLLTIAEARCLVHCVGVVTVIP
jgi:hypothetical protein